MIWGRQPTTHFGHYLARGGGCGLRPVSRPAGVSNLLGLDKFAAGLGGGNLSGPRPAAGGNSRRVQSAQSRLLILAALSEEKLTTQLARAGQVAGGGAGDGLGGPAGPRPRAGLSQLNWAAPAASV